jgi:hypothetical protein
MVLWNRLRAAGTGRWIPLHWRIRFLVASRLVRDLLFRAKHLFVAAMAAIVLAEAQG